MQLKRRFRLLLGIQFALAICVAIFTAFLFRNQADLSRAHQVHFESYLLADELRQSSDDLTRLARAFVTTGDEEFERQYWAVLDIRNGRIRRPQDYHRIYWDLVTAQQPKPRPDAKAISLHELMIREGFTGAELARLATAQQYSDALVQTEKIAINAAKGRFDDGTGNFSVTRAPDRALAIRLMNDDAYHQNKARIMRPIDEFYAMLAERTAGEVARFERRSRVLLAASAAMILAILGLFVFSFVTLWRQMVRREQAETAQSENEARIRVLGDNLPSGMIYQLQMGPDKNQRRFTYVSAGVERLHEVAAPAVLEDAGLLYRQIEAEDRPMVAAQEAEALASMKPFHAELRSRRPSGEVRWHLVTSAPRRTADGHVLWDGIELDITERKQIEAELRESEARYRDLNTELEERVARRTSEVAARNREIQALLDSIPDTVLVCDANGAVLSSHSPANALRADSLVEELARAIQSVAIASDQTVVREFEPVLSGGATAIEARATRVGLDRVLVLLRDISDRKRSERQVLKNLEKERALSEMKSQFITVASHEFRTPLSTAIGSVELLERHSGRLSEAKRAELFTRIRRALDRLTSIMDDMLMLSRADSGLVQVARMEVDLARFVADVVRNAEAADQGQHVFAFQHSGARPVVPADTRLLHHILSNLLANSLLYSPSGTRVLVELEIGPTGLSLTVTDEGIGVPEAERARIFEPFVRGTNIGQIAGTGLGLNLAKRYAELMDGRIELLPTARGASFRVTIPFLPAPVRK